MKLSLFFIMLVAGGALSALIKLGNPQLKKDLFEGDIKLPEYDMEAYAAKDVSNLWPEGVVPYFISPVFNRTLKTLIQRAMTRIEEATQLNGKKCISFVEKRNLDIDFVSVEHSETCWSHIGRKGGEQTVSIGPACSYGVGSVMHEFVHTLGFFHEQSRPDRDYYVQINRENIMQGAEGEFEKYAVGTMLDHLNQPYDYNSIMHYRSDSFAKDPSMDTITPFVKGAVIGQRDKLSFIDIKMIQLLYNCQVAADGSNGKCQDQLDNCELYGQYACITYPIWAEKYCPVTCKTCVQELKCEDKETNCASLGKSFCTSKFYEEWATKNCAKYCELGPACKTAKEASEPAAECRDKIDTCDRHGGLAVCTTYKAWAAENCEKYCQYCSDVNTPTCVDIVDGCADYGRGICNTHKVWAEENCQKYCSFCTDPNDVKTAPTTPTPSDCVDVDDNCNFYPISDCTNTGGDYHSYMIVNCLNTCNLCHTQKNCVDEDGNCNFYPISDCTNTGGDYHSYMIVNCLNTCNLCHT